MTPDEATNLIIFMAIMFLAFMAGYNLGCKNTRSYFESWFEDYKKSKKG